jgi:hypothetical protein
LEFENRRFWWGVTATLLGAISGFTQIALVK